MTCYSTLEKDEEDIIIPFVVSLYITSTKIVELLPGYLECLRRDECPEVLGVNLDMMTSTAYWMKNNKLKHDMEALNDLPKLIGDVMVGREQITGSELKDQVCNRANIGSWKFYDKLLEQAVNERIIMKTFDKVGHVIYTPAPF